MTLDKTPPNQTDVEAMQGTGSMLDMHVINTPEELPEELQCHVHDPDDGLFVWLHHPPLCHDVSYRDTGTAGGHTKEQGAALP